MTTRRLLALNVGSSTLKGASYLLNAEVPGAQPRVVERSRVEISVGPDAQERLATLLETLSETAAGPEVVVLGRYVPALYDAQHNRPVRRLPWVLLDLPEGELPSARIGWTRQRGTF